MTRTLLTTQGKMLNFALEKVQDYRCILLVFIPDTATIKQTKSILYWPKSKHLIGSAEEEDCFPYEGLLFHVSIKPDCLSMMVTELTTVKGGLVKGGGY